MPATWLTPDDPWLTSGMRHAAAIARHEHAIAAAVVAAMTEYLRRARARVLDHTVEAAGRPLPPNLDGIPPDAEWVEILTAYLSDPLSAAFGEAFLAGSRSSAHAVDPYREAYLAAVADRLSTTAWPAGVYEEIRYEIQEAAAQGESVDEVRDRVGRVLDIDAPSREVRAEINAHKAAGREVPPSLYRDLASADRAWQPDARRIARTEVVGAYNAGAYDAAKAWQDASGETRFKLWLATSDQRTRRSHAAAHGQVRPFNEPFDVGQSSMDRPHDPTAPAGETIQCRCTILVLDEAEASAARDRYETELPNRTDRYGRPIVADAHTNTPAGWEGPLCPLGALSGDRRMIATPDGDEAPRVTDHPWLSYQRQSSEGHDGKIPVGRVEETWVADADLDGNPTPHLWARGSFDHADPDVPEVVRKIADGYAGTVSVDLDDCEVEEQWHTPDGQRVEPPSDEELDRLFDGEDIGKEPVDVASDWRLAGVTLVQDPAFHTGFITATNTSTSEEGDMGADTVTAGASGKAGLPLAGTDVSWDASGATTRLAEAGKLADGHFWRDPDADEDTQAAYKLPFADVLDGRVTAVPAGVHAAAAVVQGGRGGADIPEADLDAVRSRIAGYYEAMDETPPWEDDSGESGGGSATTAAGGKRGSWSERVAAAVPYEPPRAWFANPELTGPTKVRVTDEGRVYGHLAAWGTEHAALPGQAPPRCPEGGTYPRFHRHGVRTADGDRIQTGPLATSGHADTRASVSAAMAHYDDPNFVIADVVVGEDAHGIWCSGTLRPGVSAMQVLAADRYSFSGDWREGGYLVAACSVSVPGFHLNDRAEVEALAASASGVVLADAATRRREDADGYTHALVASGIVRAARPATAKPDTTSGGGSSWSPEEWFAGLRRAERRTQAAERLRRRVHTPRALAAAARVRNNHER